MKRYNNIWDKVNGDIKKEFDSELVYNKFFEKQNNFSKAKTKFCLSLHYKGDESYLYLKKQRFGNLRQIITYVCIIFVY